MTSRKSQFSSKAGPLNLAFGSRRQKRRSPGRFSSKSVPVTLFLLQKGGFRPFCDYLGSKSSDYAKFDANYGVKFPGNNFSTPIAESKFREIIFRRRLRSQNSGKYFFDADYGVKIPGNIFSTPIAESKFREIIFQRRLRSQNSEKYFFNADYGVKIPGNNFSTPITEPKFREKCRGRRFQPQNFVKNALADISRGKNPRKSLLLTFLRLQRLKISFESCFATRNSGFCPKSRTFRWKIRSILCRTPFAAEPSARSLVRLRFRANNCGLIKRHSFSSEQNTVGVFAPGLFQICP